MVHHRDAPRRDERTRSLRGLHVPRNHISQKSGPTNTGDGTGDTLQTVSDLCKTNSATPSLTMTYVTHLGTWSGTHVLVVDTCRAVGEGFLEGQGLQSSHRRIYGSNYYPDGEVRNDPTSGLTVNGHRPRNWRYTEERSRLFVYGSRGGVPKTPNYFSTNTHVSSL